MVRLSRRAALAGFGGIGLNLVPFHEWLATDAVAQPAARVRYDVASPRGQQMLAKYATAVQRMSQRTPGDPCSWTFQWYTHWVRGSTTKAAEITRIYPVPSPNQTLARAMWNTCQAHGPGMDETMFMPWHRMYVFHFENIIRQVLNDNTFTLPYWNYSAPATSQMPAAFRNTSSPLYRPSRNAGPNGGASIPANLVALTALQETSYTQLGAAQGFCAALDFGLHGNVHVWIGTPQGMGSVPWAAFDPIFWMHHCNIDRLWESWNRQGRSNPTGAWLQQSFVFANPQCQRVVTSVNQVDRVAKLNYTYDRYETVAPLTAEAARRSGRRPAETMLLRESAPAFAAATSAPVVLGAAPVRVELKLPSETPATPDLETAPPHEPGSAGRHDDASPAARAAVAGALPERMRVVPRGRQVFLVLENVATDLQPGVVYDVFLGPDVGNQPDASSPGYAGTINFFAAGHPEGTGGDRHVPRSFSLDVTNAVRALARGNELSDTPTVTIVPAGQPQAGAKPVIGRIKLVEQ